MANSRRQAVVGAAAYLFMTDARNSRGSTDGIAKRAPDLWSATSASGA